MTYTVKPGDTLYGISNQYGVSVDDIIRLNNLTNTSLSIGQTLEIPIVETNISSYTVKSGDTLYKIAQANNTTVDELKQLNNLSNNTLSIGQVLKVPTNTQNLSNNYTVKSGDTLYKIAQANNTTVDELKQLNNLSSNILSIGQVLKLK